LLKPTNELLTDRVNNSVPHLQTQLQTIKFYWNVYCQ